MAKYITLIVLALALGCSEAPCPCTCGGCGIECRNRCEDERCVIGERCCEACTCPKKPPIKVK